MWRIVASDDRGRIGSPSRLRRRRSRWSIGSSGGIPRLINLLCDRALLAGFSLKANRITPDMVQHAATSLELQPAILRPFEWLKRRASLASAAAVVLMAAALAVGATASARTIRNVRRGPLHASAAVPPWAPDTSCRRPSLIDAQGFHQTMRPRPWLPRRRLLSHGIGQRRRCRGQLVDKLARGVRLSRVLRASRSRTSTAHWQRVLCRGVKH